MNDLVAIFGSIAILGVLTNAVPPEACFANFRWEDCGKPPQPVMYYWKPGSRCEVGIWRGCLPSLNMFKDEYECVSTCIFSVRAQPIDFHNKNAIPGDEFEMDGTEPTTTDGNTAGNETVTGGSEDATTGIPGEQEGESGGGGGGGGEGGGAEGETAPEGEPEGGGGDAPDGEEPGGDEPGEEEEPSE